MGYGVTKSLVKVAKYMFLYVLSFILIIIFSFYCLPNAKDPVKTKCYIRFHHRFIN